MRAGRAGMAGSAKARGYSLARVVPARAAGGNALGRRKCRGSQSSIQFSNQFSSQFSIQFSIE